MAVCLPDIHNQLVGNIALLNPYDGEPNVDTSTPAVRLATGRFHDHRKIWRTTSGLLLFLLVASIFILVGGVCSLLYGPATAPNGSSFGPMNWTSIIGGGGGILLWAIAMHGAYAKMRRNLYSDQAWNPNSFTPKEFLRWNVRESNGRLELSRRRVGIAGEMVFPGVIFVFMGGLGLYCLWHVIRLTSQSWLSKVVGVVVMLVILALPVGLSGLAVVYGFRSLIFGNTIVFDRMAGVVFEDGKKKYDFSDIEGVVLALAPGARSSPDAMLLLRLKLKDGSNFKIDGTESDDPAGIYPFAVYLAGFIGLDLSEARDPSPKDRMQPIS